MPKLDYREEERLARQRNIRELVDLLSNNTVPHWLNIKIEGFCDRNGFDFDFIKYKILNDPVFAVSFIKDPTKQSFHQNLAVEFMKNLPNVSDFQLLPNKGPGSIYVISGMIQTADQRSQSSDSSRSVDFVWTYTNPIGEKIQCYASHKYTHEDGGHQNQQFAEIKKFMEEGRKHIKHHYFYAICDGRFYQLPYEGSLTKIEHLNKCHAGQRCCALTINDIEDHMLNNL